MIRTAIGREIAELLRYPGKDLTLSLGLMVLVNIVLVSSLSPKALEMT